MTERQNRAEQKERTRRAILDAALRLSADTPLAALSLRQVAREAGIQAPSFYVHFDSTDALGLALVAESFGSLREVLREARENADRARVLRASAQALALHARDHRDHFGFIARERFSGSVVVRQAVRTQLTMIETELAIDLARLIPVPWPADDVRAMAKLIVMSMVQTVGDLVAGELTTEDQVREQAETFLKMLFIGATHWRPELSRHAHQPTDPDDEYARTIQLSNRE